MGLGRARDGDMFSQAVMEKMLLTNSYNQVKQAFLEMFYIRVFAIFKHKCWKLAFGWMPGVLSSVQSFSGAFLKVSNLLKC